MQSLIVKYVHRETPPDWGFQNAPAMKYVTWILVGSLLQAFDSLLQRLHKYVPYGASVADMYAGAGVIGLSLAVAKKCRQVTLVSLFAWSNVWNSKVSYRKVT